MVEVQDKGGEEMQVKAVVEVQAKGREEKDQLLKLHHLELLLLVQIHPTDQQGGTTRQELVVLTICCLEMTISKICKKFRI